MDDPAARGAKPYLGVLAWAALLGLAIWAFWIRYRLLVASPYPLGVDGYFYPVELRSLLETGSLYYPSSPLAIWFMAPLAAVTDPITGAKLGAALGTSLAVVPMYILGRRIGGSPGAGFLSAALVASSPGSVYLATEFVKQGLGLTVLATYLCVLAWTLERGEKAPRGNAHRWRVALTIAALAATALTHMAAFGMAMVATIPPLVPVFLTAWRGRSPRTRVMASVAGWALAIGAGLTLALALIAPHATSRTMHALPSLALGMFDGSWDFSVPALHALGDTPLRFQYEALIAGALGLVVVVAIAIRAARSGPHRPDALLVVGPALLAAIAALPFLDVSDPQGLAFRLRISAFVPLALSSAFIARWLRTRMASRSAEIVLLSFAIAFAAARPGPGREGLVEVHPAMQAGMRALDGVLPAGDVLIVPERHLMFMATWYTGYPARLRPEPVAPERRWRLVPMAYMSEKMSSLIDSARSRSPASLVRPRGLHPGHRNGLVVMPESTWTWILERLPADQMQHYRSWPTL